ncbi:membrane protein [soil metagenome]
MIKRFSIIVALLFTVITAAQEGTSSPYSYYGIGLTKFKGTVENQSMGGLLLYSDSIHVNLRNPAGYGKLKLTTYTVGGSHQRTSLSTSNDSENNSTTSLDYLAIGIPTGKLNFGLGLIPYSAVGYRIENINENTANRFTGRGGLNKVFLTTAYAFTEDLSVGVDVNYNFGNIQNNFTVYEGGVQFGTRQINRTDFSGFNLNFGVDYRTRLNSGLNLHTAATYSPEMQISAERMRSTVPVSFILGRDVIPQGHTANTSNFPEEQMNLPAQFTLGSGIGRPNKWFMGAEYTNIQAADYRLNSGATNLDFRYENASQYRVGGFYVPQYNSLTSYFNRVVYRAGLRYEESGLYLNNEAINEFGITFGIGLPAGNNFSNANIGLEYGQRGTTNSGLIKENFFKLSLSLSLSERWFLRTRFD